MGRMTKREFMGRTAPTGGFFNVKKIGRSVGFINCHPDNGGYWSRMVHPMFASEDDKGDKSWHNHNCVNQEDDDKKKQPCPLCLLKDFAERELADGCKDTSVLIGAGRGREAIDFNLVELAQLPKDKRRHLSAVKEEIALPWVSLEPDLTKEEKPVKLFTATSAVLYGLQKLIADESKEHGEEDGDPVNNPYPIAIIYDGDAKRWQDYWSISRSSKDIDIDEDLQYLLDVDPMEFEVDLEKETGPGVASEMLADIEAAWASKDITFKSFREFYEKRAGRRTGRDKKNDDKKGKGGKRAAKKPESEPEPEEEVEMTECGECDGEIRMDALTCQHCGVEFEVEEGEPEEDGKPEGKKGETWCEKCQEFVKPNRNGRCPECLAELDPV